MDPPAGRAPALCRVPGPLLLALLASTGCGSGSQATPTATTRRAASATPSTAHPRPVAVRFVVAPVGRLPAPVEDPATTAAGADDGVLFGGLSQADASVGSIVRVRGAVARAAGTLPGALHDAAAAAIGGRAYLFGGGNLGSSAAILRDGVHRVGSLPVAASDVAAATVGHVVYVVGGYDGSNPLDTIVAWSPGRSARVVAHMPRVLRYAAVAATGGKVIIAGGTSGVAAQRAILAFDPATGAVHQIGLLPAATTHAAAGTLAGRVLMIGGRGSAVTAQSRAIVAIDPASGRAERAGRLPRALSDAGAATLADRILVVGGRDRGGTVSDQMYAVTPSR